MKKSDISVDIPDCNKCHAISREMERKITFRFGHSQALKNHISFLIWIHLVFAIIHIFRVYDRLPHSVKCMCIHI